MVGAAREFRGSTATALFRFDCGGFPVCCVNLAFSVAIAAAASGNMAFIVEGSRPDCRFTDADVDCRESEFLVESTFSLFMASLRRLDIGSLSKFAGERTPDMGWLLPIC
jgi:hypothetical protein